MSGRRQSEPWRFRWSHGSGAVAPLGAMATACFHVDGLGPVEPFAVAPWVGDPEAAAGLPGLIAGLQGEWPCVPFGIAGPGRAIAERWQDVWSAAPEGPPHGFASNHAWSLVEEGDGAVTMRIDYPPEHAIAWLERTVRGVPGEARVEFELTVSPRRDARLPVGLHPTFRLPESEGAMLLRPGRFAFGLTAPSVLEPGAELAATDRRFAALEAVPGFRGGTVDLGRLPLAEPAEDLLQLCGIDGSFELHNLAEGYALRLEWDRAALPSCLLWISNRGIAAPPWNGRHLALGVEPACSAFDKGTTVSRATNPIAAEGIPTTVAFRAGELWRTRYAVAVRGIG